ncbi:SAF domain protein [Corynebacterium aquatimens]|nr:SAF domain-containing protein [Corynebacterium aquatimens]WJY66312.1 SAF domain protein [Corynebacterium aquatimens]
MDYARTNNSLKHSATYRPAAGESSSAAVVERLRSSLATPGYRRSVILRRFIAGVLILIACASALGSRAKTDPLIAVATTAKPAGAVLGDGDVTLTPVPEHLIPDSAVRDVDAVTGQVLASPISPGEVLTTSRVIGPDLVSLLLADAPPDQRDGYTMVPVKLAEPDVIPMLHLGDVVDVVTITAEQFRDPSHESDNDRHGPPRADAGSARVIARGGHVVLAGAPAGPGDSESSRSSGQNAASSLASTQGQGTVLLLLRSDDATAVAAASLNSPLTLVLSATRS